MPRRLITPSWYQRHSHVWAYVLLAVVAVVALAREEQLRTREAAHSNRADAAIRMQAHDLCLASNQGRIEGNRRAKALRESLKVDYSILHQAAQQNPDPVAKIALNLRADEFRRIAAGIHDLPPIDCTTQR